MLVFKCLLPITTIIDGYLISKMAETKDFILLVVRTIMYYALDAFNIRKELRTQLSSQVLRTADSS